MRAELLLLTLLFLFLLAGCTPVKSWQKGTLTKPAMSFEPDPLRSRFMQHTYESKEAASGGYGIAGAGCGCK